MSPKIAKQHVTAFLRQFKKAVREDGFFMVPRTKNLAALAFLGITIEEAKQIVFALSPAAYVSGPEADDRGRTGEVWVFQKVYDQQLLYMKLTFDPIGKHGCRAKVLSFHEAGHEDDRPFKPVKDTS